MMFNDHVPHSFDQSAHLPVQRRTKTAVHAGSSGAEKLGRKIGSQSPLPPWRFGSPPKLSGFGVPAVTTPYHSTGSAEVGDASLTSKVLPITCLTKSQASPVAPRALRCPKLSTTQNRTWPFFNSGDMGPTRDKGSIKHR